MSVIPLTQGFVSLVNDSDSERLSGQPCSLARRGNLLYAQFKGPEGKPVLLHRFIMDAPKGIEVHHVNGDGLDNRRSNLRLATRQQNAAGFQRKRPGSKSRFRGVTWLPRDRVWMARITVNGRSFYLGRFNSEKDAAIAYNAAALQYFRNFAQLNAV